MRVLLPAAAFYTAVIACSEFSRRRKALEEAAGTTSSVAVVGLSRAASKRSIRTVGLVVVAIEAPCMLCIGVLLALGQYGPMVLPVSFHFFGYFLFAGLSVVTTIMLALIVREEANLMNLEHKQSVLINRPWLLMGITVAFLGLDVATGFTDAFGTKVPVSQFHWNVLSIGSLALSQAVAGVYFLVQARAFSFLLFYFLKHARNNSPSENEQKTAILMRLIFWLHVTGATMLFSTLTLGVLVLGIAGVFSTVQTGWPWFAGVFSFSLGRILVSFSQIQIIKPTMDPLSRIIAVVLEVACFYFKSASVRPSSERRPGRTISTDESVRIELGQNGNPQVSSSQHQATSWESASYSRTSNSTSTDQFTNPTLPFEVPSLRGPKTNK